MPSAINPDHNDDRQFANVVQCGVVHEDRVETLFPGST